MFGGFGGDGRDWGSSPLGQMGAVMASLGSQASAFATGGAGVAALGDDACAVTFPPQKHKGPRHARRSGGGAATSAFNPRADAAFIGRAASTIPGDVRVFSGCKDAQTSADVSNVASFGLPPVSGPEKAGGACTNALLAAVAAEQHKRRGADFSFGQLLRQMQSTMQARRFNQVPQLSTSRQLDMNREPWAPRLPGGDGRTKALLIGINYSGQKGELHGCVNDVKQMQRYLAVNGFATGADRMRVLTDDASFGRDGPPTRANIEAGMRWLLEGAAAGDSLFVRGRR